MNIKDELPEQIDAVRDAVAKGKIFFSNSGIASETFGGLNDDPDKPCDPSAKEESGNIVAVTGERSVVDDAPGGYGSRIISHTKTRTIAAYAMAASNPAERARGNWVRTWSIRSQPVASELSMVVSDMGEH